MKAALYARYSTDKQRDESIEDQFRECERVAQANGFEIVARYEDKGISGGTAERPGYQQLLAAARRKEFIVIVAEDISRLWRNRAEFGPRSAELEDLRVNMVTAVGDDTRRDGWGLTVQIKQAMAEHARREASYRTRRGLEGKAIKGEAVGGRAYAYVPASDSASGQVEIDEAQASVVRRIFEMYADGNSPRVIANRLNADGLLSPGASWHRTSIAEHSKRRGKWVASAIHGDPKRGYGILNNQKYIGRIVWGHLQWVRGASNSNKRTAVKADASALVVTDAQHLRIVSDELWAKVKERQRSQALGTRSKAGKPATSLLSGLLVCGECGSRFVARNQSSYQCASRAYGGASACANGILVKRDLAEASVIDFISRELLSDEAVEIAKRAYKEALKERLATPQGMEDDGMAALSIEEQQVRDLMKSRTLSPDVAHAALEAIYQKRKRLSFERRARDIGGYEGFGLDVERYQRTLRELGQHVAASDCAPEHRQLIRDMLGGTGTVFDRDGRIGAQFSAAGLLAIAQYPVQSESYNCGSGGRI